MNTQDLSIINLVLHASFVVQLVIAILLAMSLASWTVIFSKLFGLKRVRALNDGFEREFWSGQTLQALYDDANGVGAFAAMLSGVPEPGSTTLVFIAATFGLVTRLRSARGR